MIYCVKMCFGLLYTMVIVLLYMGFFMIARLVDVLINVISRVIYWVGHR